MKDLVLVVAPQNRGWILERVCREIASTAPERCSVHVWDGTIPEARAVFFSHFSLLSQAVDLASVREARRSVFFTHPPPTRRARLRTAHTLRDADVIISMSSIHARALRHWGLGRRVRTVIPGCDPGSFRPHPRGRGVIGFCSAYYPRKAPDALLSIVRAMPEEEFLLVGRGWEEWHRWPELLRTENLRYVEAPYSSYPECYDQMDIFVSPSEIEGGPIPLLESMMSNVVPVVTRTGFAPDLITEGYNGYIVKVGSTATTFRHAIDQARRISTDIRATVAHRTWNTFGSEVIDLVT